MSFSCDIHQNVRMWVVRGWKLVNGTSCHSGCCIDTGLNRTMSDDLMMSRMAGVDCDAAFVTGVIYQNKKTIIQASFPLKRAIYLHVFHFS